MKKNWKKTVSVLLLTALLCALPGAVSWAEGTTDVSSITPDGPTVNQPGGDSGTSGTSGTDTSGSGTTGTSGTDTSGSTGTSGTSGTDTSGSTGTSGTSGTDTSGSTGTTGTSGTDTSGSTGTTGTSGTDTSGSGTTAGQGGTTDTTGDSTTSGTTGGQTSSDSGTSPVIVVDGSVVTPSDTATTPVQPSVPEATPTPTPSPTPTPAPTATPTPTPSLPVVTKDPTDETVDAGGDCWFIANYSNAKYAVWHFVSPDGKTDYRYNDPAVATAFPGLKIENGDQSNLHLSSIPTQMNGWGSYCEYSNDTGSVRTNYAVVHVNGAPAATPSPSPSATPTAKPSPTPTPSATTTPAPTSVPVATPSPVVSPTPEGTGEPPAALNRGGKIFLLFGAAALVVGAAAIGTILTVSKRASAKEAYTYKNSTRRRK